MPNRSSSKLDANQMAHRVARLAAGEAVADLSTKPKRHRKNPAAVALGRMGGLKGGKARAAALSPAKRSQIAKKAAAARWSAKPE